MRAGTPNARPGDPAPSAWGSQLGGAGGLSRGDFSGGDFPGVFRGALAAGTGSASPGPGGERVPGAVSALSAATFGGRRGRPGSQPALLRTGGPAPSPGPRLVRAPRGAPRRESPLAHSSHAGSVCARPSLKWWLNFDLL